MVNHLCELCTDALSTRLFQALLVGVLMGGLLLVEGLVLANVIFVGPLSPYVSNGIGLLLSGSAVFCLLVALTSGHRGMIACPQAISAAVLGTIGAMLAQTIAGASGEILFMTMVAVLILSTTITSLCFLALGQCRIAKLLRFVPYPVACGVLAGTGWVLCVAALSMMCALPLEWRMLPRLLEPAMLLKLGLGVAFCLSLVLVMKRWNNYLVVAASFVIVAALYHLGLILADITVEEAKEASLLFAGMPDSGVWPAFELGDLALVDWGSVAEVAPNLLTVTLVTLLKLAMNLHGLELDTDQEIDTDREFRVAGFSGLVAAAGGSIPGCQSLGYSRFSHMVGADTRLTGIVAAAVVSLCALFGGRFVALMPVSLTAGVLLFVGVGLLSRWLFSVREKLRWTEYGVVLLTCVTIAAFGFIEGIGLGLIATMVLLVVRLGRMEVIEAEFTGRDQCSTTHRTVPERALLLDQGERMRIYQLRGFVFFGSVHRLLDRVKAALRDTPQPACIVLDCARVSGFDFSAANALCRLLRSTHATGTRLVLAAAPGLLKDDLRDNLPADLCDRVLFEADVDHGLQRGEDVILAPLRDASGTPPGHLIERVFDDMKRYLDRQIVFEDMVQRLEPWLEPRDYRAGDALAARGEPQAGVQLLVMGRAAVYDGADVRISQCGPGTAVEPQAAFGPSVAANSTIAGTSCRTMLFTPNARLLLEALDPTLGLQFYRFLVTRTSGFANERDGTAVLRQLARWAQAGSADRPADAGGSAAAASSGSSLQGTGSPDLTGQNDARGVRMHRATAAAAAVGLRK